MLLSRFVSPQQIASTYVDEAETGELLRMLRVCRKTVMIVNVAAVIVVSIFDVTVEKIPVSLKLTCDANGNLS